MSTAPTGLPVRWRLPLLAAGLVSLVLGTLAGLVRAGVPLPAVQPTHVGMHAALMLGGFFGTVIGLERAVALGARWAYLAPALSAAAAVGIWAGADGRGIAALQLGSGLTLAAGSWRLHVRQPQLHSMVLLVAAVCWPLGSAAWLTGFDPARAIPLWSNFLVLTIAGERLELSRLMAPRPRAKRLFVAIAAVCLAAGALAVIRRGTEALLGIGYVALGAWLVTHDIARRTARAQALTGFVGRALLGGYAWLLIGGVAMLASVSVNAPLLRDAALHAVLVGFVMSMVFGHAPLIFPAVVRIRIPYHRGLYLPLVLLHAGLVARIAGDLTGAFDWRAAGAVANAVALGAFVVITAGSALAGRIGGAR